MQRHDWSSTNPKEPMLHLSLSPCTGYQLQLASSSRHWCLHIEQPQAQHPPTSTHYYESTSPPEVWDLLVSDASWYCKPGPGAKMSGPPLERNCGLGVSNQRELSPAYSSNIQDAAHWGVSHPVLTVRTTDRLQSPFSPLPSPPKIHAM